MSNLSDHRLYGILDLSYVDVLDATPVVRRMIRGGVDLIQLRVKHYTPGRLAELALQLHEITSLAQVPLIVNDHAEVARSVRLEGVHVGQDDLPVADVRRIVGRPLIVGKSTHNLAQAIAAAEEGADYIGFGPLFATPTKPDYVPIGLNDIGKVHKAVQIPVFCIGGIKLDNLEAVVAAGAQRVVIVSGLLQSENIEAYAKAAKQMLLSTSSLIGNRHSKI